MTRPYSIDLRERVLRDLLTGDPVRAIAGRFDVSPSFVSKLGIRYRERGSVAPDRQGGDRRSEPIEAHRDWLLDGAAAQPDRTLDEIRRELLARGLEVSVMTVWRFFERHGLSYKKRRLMPASRNVPM
jgi:transposase